MTIEFIRHIKAFRAHLQRHGELHPPVGRGQRIAFAEDPNFRAYAEATQLLFLNAVLQGAAR